MSSEITVTAGLQVANGGLKFQSGTIVSKVDQAGTHETSNVQDIPTTAGGTAVTLGPNIGTPGWGIFTNLDSTNYLQIGVQVAGTFYPLIKLKPLESMVFRLATATFYALANTATCSLGFTILQD